MSGDILSWVVVDVENGSALQTGKRNETKRKLKHFYEFFSLFMCMSVVRFIAWPQYSLHCSPGAIQCRAYDEYSRVHGQVLLLKWQLIWAKMRSFSSVKVKQNMDKSQEDVQNGVCLAQKFSF